MELVNYVVLRNNNSVYIINGGDTTRRCTKQRKRQTTGVTCNSRCKTTYKTRVEAQIVRQLRGTGQSLELGNLSKTCVAFVWVNFYRPWLGGPSLQVETSKARVSLSRSFASKDRNNDGPFSRVRGATHDGPRAMVEPMVLQGRGSQDPEASPRSYGSQALPRNPTSAPLTRELCERVAEELGRVTSYAIQIFQRVTMDMELSPSDKSTMTNTLAQGVLQAQQNLRPAAPPMPVWGAPPPPPVPSAPPSQQPPPLPSGPPPPLPESQPPSSVPAVFQQYPAARRFVTNGATSLQAPLDPLQQFSPLGRKGDQMSQSTSDLNALLQQYSEQLMKMVKEQINQAKSDKTEGQ